MIDIKNLNRRSYKGLDDYGGNIAVGDGYYNDAYEDEESKWNVTLNQNKYHFYMMKLQVITFFTNHFKCFYYFVKSCYGRW